MKIPLSLKIQARYLIDLFFILAARITRRFTNKNLIVMVRIDAIGDFILWLDAARQMREHYKDSQIVLVANHLWADFASSFSYWDRVIPVDIHAFSFDNAYRRKQIQTMCRLNAYLAIQPVFSRTCDTGDSLIRATAAASRIGSQGDLSNATPLLKSISDSWYTKLIPAIPFPLMELQRNSEFLRGLGIGSTGCQSTRLPTVQPVKSFNLLPAKYFVVFPGAGWEGRIWPMQMFASLIERVVADTELSAVLCGGPNEIHLGEAVQRLCHVDTLSLIGKTSLNDLSEVIRHAQFLVGNETSAIHIAAAVHTKSICITGGGHYGRFVPYQCGYMEFAPIVVNHSMPCYNCNWQCPYFIEQEKNPVPCIANISVEQVYDACRPCFHKPLLSERQ